MYMFSTRAEETMSVDELLPAWRLAHVEKAGSIVYWRKLLREASNTRGEQKNSTPQHKKHEQ